MPVLDHEDPADPSQHEPEVTGSPDRIWLVYGELERDDTHAAICRDGEVTWCADKQYSSDVEYVRADIAADLVTALRALTEIAVMQFGRPPAGADGPVPQALAAIAKAIGDAA